MSDHLTNNNNSKETQQEIIGHEMKYDTRQIQYAIKALNKAIDACIEKVTGSTKELNKEVSDLREEGYMLRKLPETTKDYLHEMLPEISKELMVNIFQDLDKVVRTIHDNLAKVESRMVKSFETAQEKLNESVKTSLNFNSLFFKKLLINTAIVVLISTATATVTSYLMIKKFPQRIDIKADKGVTIDNSEITFWGPNSPQIYNKKEK